uniref:Peptidase_M14 domain-containing protein n=1 Tax=Caenorhabditis japonica TaxID=281687 RepID=A0A8R1IG30_CAEJA
MGPQSLVVHLFLMVIATFAQQDLSWKADIFASDREMQMSEATRLNYPNITHLYSVGKSVEGRELWVLIISDKPTEHEILEPELKIVGNMHGNEVVGREAVLYLIEILCTNYGKNKYLTDLVNNARFHLMPSMNPDGYEKGYPGDRISAMVL